MCERKWAGLRAISIPGEVHHANLLSYLEISHTLFNITK